MILEMNFRRFRGVMWEFGELNDRRKTHNRQILVQNQPNQPKACDKKNLSFHIFCLFYIRK